MKICLLGIEVIRNKTSFGTAVHQLILAQIAPFPDELNLFRMTYHQNLYTQNVVEDFLFELGWTFFLFIRTKG